jgi:hypothetical protein
MLAAETATAIAAKAGRERRMLKKPPEQMMRLTSDYRESHGSAKGGTADVGGTKALHRWLR